MEYRVVWVSEETPDIVEEVFAEGIENLEEAKDSLEDARVYNEVFADGLNWVPRIQQITFI